ncbi:hypothetical protein FRX31_031440 [Thalictrum thalictroides]|uniref:Uncharacterized protein n=1 Tax=Thalictrum thalictroides TaxID=46969 RepID=A0A7J6V1V8_THATH|nr:hypothetical protein FRX31_031440 [Thalictrum thalictroides]
MVKEDVKDDNEGRGSTVVENVEEGEISDESQSVEEISEEDFVKQESKKDNEKENFVSSSSTNSTVWMNDLYKYSSNYGSKFLSPISVLTTTIFSPLKHLFPPSV